MRTVQGFAKLFAACVAVVALQCVPAQVGAQTITLKLHNFNSPRAIANRLFMVPWAKKLKEESGGRLNIQVYPAMQLGGKPKDLYAQARDGVVDMAWSLQGYTAGQFPLSSITEIPFVAPNAETMSRALMQLKDKYLQHEYRFVHVIVLHAADVVMFHTKAPVHNRADLAGKKIRVSSRQFGNALEALGGTPVSMPIPALPQALARGQVEGFITGWSIMLPFKLQELTKYTVEVDFGASPFMLIMNKQSYAKLPRDLRKLIDDSSTPEFAAHLGHLWDEDAVRAKKVALAAGGKAFRLSGAELAAWKRAEEPVTKRWIAMANSHGVDGQAMYDDYVKLVAAGSH